MAKTLPAIVVTDAQYARLAAILPGSTAAEKVAAYTSRTLAYWRRQVVDAEIRAILDKQYALARRLLEENRDKVEVMTRALLDWETIDADQINDIMAGQEPRAPKVIPPKRTPPGDGGPGGVAPNVTAPA